MKKIILTVLAAGMVIFFSGTSLIAGDGSLSKSSQLDIQDCKERISLLEEKVESLETALQKKNLSRPLFKESDTSYKKYRYNRKYNDYSLDTIECDY